MPIRSLAENATVSVFKSIPLMETLRSNWTEWGGHRDSDIDVVLMVLQSNPEVVRPHIISVLREGQPEVILVGRLERKRLPLKIGYFTLFRPWVVCLTFVYGGLRGQASAQN